MKPIYSLLSESPTSLEDDVKAPEKKNLLESSSTVEDFEPISRYVAVPRKILFIAYVFLALVVLAASMNIVLSVRQMRLGKVGEISLSDLPHPDVFVGLPKLSKHSNTTSHNMPSHDSHSHMHNHNHSSN